MEQVEVTTGQEFILRQVNLNVYQIKNIVECTSLEIEQKGLRIVREVQEDKDPFEWYSVWAVDFCALLCFCSSFKNLFPMEAFQHANIASPKLPTLWMLCFMWRVHQTHWSPIRENDFIHFVSNSLSDANHLSRLQNCKGI